MTVNVSGGMTEQLVLGVMINLKDFQKTTLVYQKIEGSMKGIKVSSGCHLEKYKKKKPKGYKIKDGEIGEEVNDI